MFVCGVVFLPWPDISQAMFITPILKVSQYFKLTDMIKQACFGPRSATKGVYSTKQTKTVDS